MFRAGLPVPPVVVVHPPPAGPRASSGGRGRTPAWREVVPPPPPAPPLAPRLLVNRRPELPGCLGRSASGGDRQPPRRTRIDPEPADLRPRDPGPGPARLPRGPPAPGAAGCARAALATAKIDWSTFGPYLAFDPEVYVRRPPLSERGLGGAPAVLAARAEDRHPRPRRLLGFHPRAHGRTGGEPVPVARPGHPHGHAGDCPLGGGRSPWRPTAPSTWSATAARRRR